MNQVPMFNICYADRVGNIFYLWNGTVPNLPHPAHKAAGRARGAVERHLDEVSRDQRACRNCSTRRAATCKTATRPPI